MANVIAVIFALPERSTHLWYHIFDPQSLEGTFVTGFMVIPHFYIRAPITNTSFWLYAG